MTPADYRSLAAEYTAAGRDADADVCEIMAQERERMDRYERGQVLTTEDDDEGAPTVAPLIPAIVETAHGQQYALPLEV